MLNSEILKAFDEQRGEFEPYGLTCELWMPQTMKKPDRHNEIEINFFPEGGITYLFQGAKVAIPEKSLAMFWGLVPHQIIEFTRAVPYYVFTIPLSQFLEWKLPPILVDKVLKGEIVIEYAHEQSGYDEYLFKTWLNDLSVKQVNQATLLEINARLLRMAKKVQPSKPNDRSPIHSNDISKVEQIAMYIAKNYSSSMKVSDIGNEVGLHPDYANSIFKKAFGVTLNEYIVQERISHAQRMLISTDKSITDISFECGFNSIGRFNAAFRKINQCTPRKFRSRFLLHFI